MPDPAEGGALEAPATSPEITTQPESQTHLETPGSEAQGGEQTEAGAATPPPAITMTHDTMRELLQGVVQQTRPQQPQQPQQPPMTQAEADRLLNVFRATPELVTQLGLQAEAVPGVQSLVEGIVRQAVTMAGYQVAALKQELLGQLTPLQQFANQTAEQQYRTEFFTQNKDLKPWEPVCEFAWDKLRQEGFQGDKATVFKAVAERARQLIKNLPNGNGQAQPNPAGTAPGAQRRMSTLSSGGQGGAGSSGKPMSNTAKAIFG